jgi:DDE superfamily endonuclease
VPYVIKIRQQLNKPNQPALFIVNSHNTSKHQPTILLFQQHNIHILILPVHSSATLQPLDLSMESSKGSSELILMWWIVRGGAPQEIGSYTLL